MKKLIPILLFAALAVLLVYAFLHSGSAYVAQRAEESFGTLETTEPKLPATDDTAIVTTEPELPDFTEAAAFFPEEKYKVTPEFLQYIYEEYGKKEYNYMVSAAKKGAYDTSLWYTACGSTLRVLYADFTGERVPLAKDAIYGGKSATLVFGGDVNFDEVYGPMKAFHEAGNDVDACIDASLLGSMRAADLFMFNSGFALTDRQTPLKKSYTFRASTEKAMLFEALGADIVSLANNHSCDFGTDGLADTLALLADTGVVTVGAGMNLAEASAIRYFEINGIRIAFTAAMRSEKYINTPEAAADKAGVMKMYTPDAYLDVIREAAQNADYVIAYAHWGAENSTALEDVQIETAHAMIDAGAKLVIGSHTHTVQELEIYNGGLIAYSLGDLWWDEGGTQGALLHITLVPNAGVYANAQFFENENGKVAPLSADKLNTLLTRLNRSATVSVDATGALGVK